MILKKIIFSISKYHNDEYAIILGNEEIYITQLIMNVKGFQQLMV